MADFLTAWWPDILAAVSLLLGVPAAIHAIMTKNDVRSAIGWTGLIVLSPVIGALIYWIAGINRVRRVLLSHRRRVRQARDGRPRGPRPPEPPLPAAGSAAAETAAPGRGRLDGLVRLGDAVTGFELTRGNRLALLADADQAYAAMLAAIETAEHSVLMESYIFRHDATGLAFADRLVAARARGVDVRVIVDAVGARYTVPSVVGRLRAGGVPTATFNGRIITGLRLPYANMRTHRKILVIDKALAFTGGMNISAGFSRAESGAGHLRDTHFALAGPAVADLIAVWWDDWIFAEGGGQPAPADLVHREAGAAMLPEGAGRLDDLAIRVVASGPDASIETNHRVILGACSVAEHSIRIASPYFLPDRELTSALMTAMDRGVRLDIVVPGSTDNRLVDAAMHGQFGQLLAGGARIVRSNGSFNHSKLMTMDDDWCYVGSSNMDPRSFRLNFEVDLEIHDARLARLVAARIDAFAEGGSPVTQARLAARSFPRRLADRTLWLASPYL